MPKRRSPIILWIKTVVNNLEDVVLGKVVIVLISNSDTKQQ